MRARSRFKAALTCTCLVVGVAVGSTAGSASAASQPTFATPWTGYGGSATHSFAALSDPLGGQLSKMWSQDLGTKLGSPVLADGAVLVGVETNTPVGSRSDLEALDPATGRSLWPPLAVTQNYPILLAAAGSTVFVSSFQTLEAVDIPTGRVLWSTTDGNEFEDPVVADGQVWDIVDRNLVGLNESTGHVDTDYPDFEGGGTPAATSTVLDSPDCVMNLATGVAVREGSSPECEVPDEGYVTVTDGTDLATPVDNPTPGLEIVGNATGATRFTVAGTFAALTGADVYAAGATSLIDVAESSGSTRWQATIPAPASGSPIVSANAVTVLDTAGDLLSYDPASGSLLSTHHVPADSLGPGLNGEAVQAMALADGLLAVPSGGSLTMFRASSVPVPSSTQPAPTVHVPVAAAGHGLDVSNGSQFGEGSAHLRVATGSTLTAPLSQLAHISLSGTASNPVVDSAGRVFVAAVDPSGGLQVTRVNRRTGHAVWGPVSVPGTSPATIGEDDGVLVVAGFGPIYTVHQPLTALDAATGHQLWTTHLPTTSESWAGYPEIDGHNIFLNAYDSNVGGAAGAVNLTTGALRWLSPVPDAQDMQSPVADSRLLYETGLQGATYALSTGSGAHTWFFNGNTTGARSSSAELSQGSLYTNQYDGSGTILNANTGQYTGSFYATRSPAIDPAADTMFALQGDRLTALSVTDQTRYWTFTGDGSLGASPLIANNLVFMGSYTGNLYALDEATGTPVWQEALPGSTISTDPAAPTEAMQLAAGAATLAVTDGSQLYLFGDATDRGPHVPDAPTVVRATPRIHGAVVTWHPPASNGGQPVTSYTVTANTGATYQVPATTTRLAVAKLSPLRHYRFRVTATSNVGTSPASASSGSITPAWATRISLHVESASTDPGTPVHLTARMRTGSAVPFGGPVALEWFHHHRWRTLLPLRIPNLGRLSVMITPHHTSRYRVRYRGTSRHGSATSRPRRVRVT